MIYIVELFALIFLLFGIVLIFRPHVVINLLAENMSSWSVYLTAIGARLLLGAALISVAAQSNYPVVLEIFGWIIILGAIILAVIGRRRMGRIIEWVLDIVSGFARIAGVIAIVGGGFLIYAVM